jgi:hypothetical protein
MNETVRKPAKYRKDGVYPTAHGAAFVFIILRMD